MTKDNYYLAIGDSLTVGYGAPPSLSFASRYYQLAQQHLGNPLSFENKGINGETTGDILQRLKQDTSLQELVKQSKIITLTAGGNDLILAGKQYALDKKLRNVKQSFNQFQHNYAEIMLTFDQLKQHVDEPYIIRIIDLYNPFPQFLEAKFWVKKFNKVIHRYNSDPIGVAHIYNAFIGMQDQLLHDDLVHPNEHGYEIITERIHQLGYASLLK